MVKVSASPDQRYGVTLANGVLKMGARQEIIKTALEAAKLGIAVIGWIIPGREKLVRHHRAELIHAAYRRELPLS
jgi:hypothetical protein